MKQGRVFLKKLWQKEKVLCPKCHNDYLIPLHRKRKDNNDFICPSCKEIYRTMNILQRLLCDNK